MKISHLRLLLSCHGWEDFPTHVTSDDADNLLASWTALWNPTLLSNAGSVPVWHRVDSPPEDCAEFLFVAPKIIREQLPTGFQQRVNDQNGLLVELDGNRDEIVAGIIPQLDNPTHYSEDRVAAFYALGFVYLQVQILTRQYRYSSSLDDTQFNRVVVEATQAAATADDVSFQSALVSCFDLLSEERNRYFSNEIYLVDWTLATGDLYKRLPKQIGLAKQNVLLDGPALRSLDADAETKQRLVDEIEGGRTCLAGGEANELRSNLISFKSIVDQFVAGKREFEKTIHRSPTIFGRQRFGTNPSYPQILANLKFNGAIHSTMDEGRFPTHPDNHVNWSGNSETSIPALVDPPHDANSAETFLQLAGNISQAIDRRHVAIIVFTHWAGQIGTWYRDLMVAAKYSSTLGRFICLDTFFQNDLETSTSQTWLGDDYRSPFHQQAIVKAELNPVSRWIEYWKSHAILHSAGATEVMTIPFERTRESKSEVFQAIRDQRSAIDLATEDVSSLRHLESASQLLAKATSHFAKVICNRQEEGGYLIVNPQSVARRQKFEFDATSIDCDQEKVIYCQDRTSSGLQAVLDIPAQGFVFLKQSHSNPSQGKLLPLVDDDLLRNEFFQVAADPKSGGIRSVMLYNQRGNLFSQQLALKKSDQRRSRSKDTGTYSSMQVDSIDNSEATLVSARCVSKGKLIHDDRTAAEFTQTVEVTRGIRVFDVQIEIDLAEKLRPNPWLEYLAARIAWNDESARIFRSVNENHDEVTIGKIESPLYLEIQGAAHKTTLFLDGMPYHRRDGYRMLDCILAPAGETARTFKFGVGIDVNNPLQVAYQRLAPMTVTNVEHSPQSSTGWVYHFSCRNVMPIHWNFNSNHGERGQTEIWLKETDGRAADLKISCPENPKLATTVDLLGDQTDQCEISDDKVLIKLTPYSFHRVIIDW